MNKASVAPVVFFAYRRAGTTRITLNALANNPQAKETDLFAYVDAADVGISQGTVEEVKTLISNARGFRSVTLRAREKHLGLSANVISGVTEVLEEYEAVIVVEDDVVTTPNFLNFMNQALRFYANNHSVFSVTGFTLPLKFPLGYDYDVYSSYRMSSWGWGIWRDRWQNIDWDLKDADLFLRDKRARKQFNRGGADMGRMLYRQFKGEIDSWAIRACFYQFKARQITIYPVVSMAEHVGYSDGTHSTRNSGFRVVLDGSTQPKDFRFTQITLPDESITERFRYNFSRPGKFLERIRRILLLPWGKWRSEVNARVRTGLK